MRISDRTMSRKNAHIRICLEKNVENARKTPGFEDVKLIYRALPKYKLSDVDLSTQFFGQQIAAPFFIDAMTGGTSLGMRINKELAAAAEEEQIPFALGSQRAMIEKPELTKTYYVRDVAPTIPIIGNIGFAQLEDKGILSKLEGALKDVGATALAVHLNPLQEIIQPEGDRDFVISADTIAELCDTVDVPVIAKEVGFGICGEVAKELERAGCAAINVAGAGGTAWGRVEILRGGKRKRFADSGIPTVWALVDVVKSVKIPVIASGGIRSGVDIAKSIALGASWASAARPFLLAWKKKKVRDLIKEWKEELAATTLLVGARSIADLRKVRAYIIGRSADYLRSIGKLS